MDTQNVRHTAIGDGADIAEVIEATLLAAGITIAPGSHLEALTLELYRIADDRRKPFHVRASDVPARYADGLGIAELAGRISAVREHPAFPRLTHDVSLLNSAATPQNRPSAKFDDSANKVFELLVACWAMQLADDFELDQPGANGSNPDIIVDIDGRRWGIACKTPYSLAPDSLLANVAGAVRQIERAGVDGTRCAAIVRALVSHKSARWSRGRCRGLTALKGNAVSSPPEKR